MLELVMLILVVVSGTGGELCVSRAMKSLGEMTDFRPASLMQFIFRALKLPWMWLGVTMMALAFFSLLAVLAIQEVSFVVPVTALSYTAGALGATAFLGERINRARWVGLAIVCVGVTIVWFSKP